MLGLEIVVVLGAAVLICSGLASRLHVAPPILLLATGILLGFVPALVSSCVVMSLAYSAYAALLGRFGMTL